MQGETDDTKRGFSVSIFFRVHTILAVGLVVILLSSCQSMVYELALTTTMSRQDIVSKFGKPDEVVIDNADGYMYIYSEGFSITGDDNGATEIELRVDGIKKNTSDTYKLMDVTIGSSFDENIKRLGEPDLALSSGGQKGAMYLTKEDFILVFLTGIDTDNVESIRLVSYSDSLESMGLDLCKILGTIATEDEIRDIYKVNNKYSDSKAATYDIKGFNLVVDNESNIITQIVIAEDGIFNFAGVRLGDTLEKAKEVFGEPLSSMEGVLNTIQYAFKYDDSLGLTAPKRIDVTIDMETGKIDYLEANIADMVSDDPVNEKSDDNTVTEAQDVAPYTEGTITEFHNIENEPKENLLQWNTVDTDAFRNGNMTLALSLVKSQEDLSSDAKPYAPSAVFKSLPKYIGQIIQITGTVEDPEDWELNSYINEIHSSTDTVGLLIQSDDFTLVYVFFPYLDDFDYELYDGVDRVTVCGYLVGDDIIGPYKTYESLVLVGNLYNIAIE